MQQIAPRQSKQEIGFDPDTERWYAHVGDVLVGDDFLSPAAAQRARDDYLILHPQVQPAPVAEEVIAQSRALLAAALEAAGDTDPLTLYASVGPFPGLPIAPGALKRAYALVLMDHGDERAVMERARRALALAEDPDAWSIPESGVLCVRGSRPNQVYLVRTVPIEDQNETIRECTQLQLDPSDNKMVLKEQPCPDHAKRVAATANLCKHLICRELIRLAQLLTYAAQATTATTTAEATLTAELVGSALNMACISKEPYIQVEIDQALLRVEVGGKHATQLTAQEGDGHCTIQLSLEVVHDLWGRLRSWLLQEQARTPFATCYIDREQATLSILGDDDFAICCPGRVL
jgi:hypothetical protein